MISILDTRNGRLAAAVTLIAVGFAAGLLLSRLPSRESPRIEQVRSPDHDLINPLLECEGPLPAAGMLVPPTFKLELNRLVGRTLESGTVSHLSVYFRDLNNGPWYGVQEQEPFYPASLLKIPVAMAIMKQAEEDRHLLKRSIRSAPGADLNARLRFKPTRSMQPGRSYRIEELLELALAESDNNALGILGAQANKTVLSEVFLDLGVRYPLNGPLDYLSVREFATFFRILYNASYLDKDASERLLAYLAGSSFRQGLVAGVPPGIPVAHKHGEQELDGDGSQKQLHDCGIVYVPDSPYLLCIMSKGATFEANAEAISAISQFVYAAVEGRRVQQPPRGPGSR
jgi:beta-lactamase class A